jgi:hypothetical protein
MSSRPVLGYSARPWIKKKKPTKIISYYFSSFNGFGFFPILSNKIEQHIFEQLMGH